MKRMKQALALGMLTASLAAMGCGAPATVDPMLVPKTQVPDPYPVEVVRSAIVDGLFAKGWSVDSESEGEVVASVTSGGHSATIRIRYDGTGWTIEHVESSPGLRYDPVGPNIHKRYNNWVKMLDNVIRKELAERSEPSSASSGAEMPAEEPTTEESAEPAAAE